MTIKEILLCLFTIIFFIVSVFCLVAPDQVQMSRVMNIILTMYGIMGVMNFIEVVKKEWRAVRNTEWYHNLWLFPVNFLIELGGWPLTMYWRSKSDV